MAHREYVDSHGLRWQAWEVIPMSSERRKLRERRFAPRDSNDRRKRHEARLRPSDGESDGWLVFDSSSSFDALYHSRGIGLRRRLPSTDSKTSHPSDSPSLGRRRAS